MNKKYKILYHHQTLLDGAEAIHILEIFNSFKKLGHDIKMIANVTSQKDKFAPDSHKGHTGLIHKIRGLLPQHVFEFVRILYNFFDLIKMYLAFRNEKADFIYKRHANYNFAPVLAARLLKIPMILEVNSIYSYKGRLIFENIKFPRISYFIENYIYKNILFIVTVSTRLKAILIKRGIKAENIIVIPNGANLDKFNPDKYDGELLKRQWGNNNIFLGFVGILRNWHGIEFFLETLRNIDLNKLNLKIIIIGDGEKRSEYEKFVQKNNMKDFIIFTGRIPHEEIPAYISAFDLSIMPDSNDYGSPMKILEYMAMQKPVLAPRLIPIEDIISNNEDGLLFERNNQIDLQKKIEFLVNNLEERNRIGNNARKKILLELNWQRNVEKTLIKYEQKIAN